MEGRTGDTRFYRILVAIETDATRFYGANATRPALLGATDSEQMLAHLAADLKSMLPDISGCSLIAPGALYDQTQVLRPSFPIFETLESVSTRPEAEDFKPGLVSIGIRDEGFPSKNLQPLPDIPLGLLQLLPIVVHGPATLVEKLGQTMEYRFLEEGQLSAHSAAWLQTAFGIPVTHARLMTLTDLNAMLRMQLEHFGFLPLWELLDAALSASTQQCTVTAENGQEFTWRDGRVHTAFESFDHWALRGTGAAQIASRQALAAGYGDWTREARQYLTTLNAHGVEVLFHDPDGQSTLDDTFFSEPGNPDFVPNASTITEHSYSELGTIAVTVCDGESISHYFPLQPAGLNDIHSHIREKVPGVHTVAFPGTILYDEKTRRLLPDTGKAAPPH